jgi:hypothetical protein
MYLTSKWLEERKVWYLNDIRRNFPKQKLLATAAELDTLLLLKPASGLDEIIKYIEKGLSKK